MQKREYGRGVLCPPLKTADVISKQKSGARAPRRPRVEVFSSNNRPTYTSYRNARRQVNRGYAVWADEFEKSIRLTRQNGKVEVATPTVDPLDKHCRTCEKWKPSAEFDLSNGASKDCPSCRPIRRIQNRARGERIRNERVRAAEGGHNDAQWQSVVDRFQRHCVRCGIHESNAPEGRLTKDHIVPISKGGSNRISNLQPLCIPCNSKKATHIADYRPSAERSLSRNAQGISPNGPIDGHGGELPFGRVCDAAGCL